MERGGVTLEMVIKVIKLNLFQERKARFPASPVRAKPSTQRTANAPTWVAAYTARLPYTRAMTARMNSVTAQHRSTPHWRHTRKGFVLRRCKQPKHKCKHNVVHSGLTFSTGFTGTKSAWQSPCTTSTSHRVEKPREASHGVHTTKASHVTVQSNRGFQSTRGPVVYRVRRARLPGSCTRLRPPRKKMLQRHSLNQCQHDMRSS